MFYVTTALNIASTFQIKKVLLEAFQTVDMCEQVMVLRNDSVTRSSLILHYLSLCTIHNMLIQYINSYHFSLLDKVHLNKEHEIPVVIFNLQNCIMLIFMNTGSSE